MKQILIIISLLSATITAYCQGNPGDLKFYEGSSTQTVIPTSVMSYILTYAYRDPINSVLTTPDISQASPEIQYFDGLGRLIETNQIRASQLGYDQVSYNRYDVYGNTDSLYLPYTRNTITNCGIFKSQSEFIAEQNSFISTLYGPTEVSKGYSIDSYEKSEIQRIDKQGAPGSAWQLTRPVDITYRTNTSADNVQTYLYNGDTPSAYTYPAGKLYVTETTDEDGKIVKEFKDIEGRLIQTEMNSAKTRYCYDEFGRLRSVLQPTATSSTGNYDAFQYKYDSRGRLTDKKFPRAVWVYYIYDSRDRLVLTQDGVQRAKTTPEWTYTIYDNLNRPVEQGTWATAISRTTLTTSINSNLIYMSGQASRISLKYLYYDVYTSVPAANAYYIADGTALNAVRSTRDISRQTGVKAKLLDTETGMTPWLFTGIYYDKFGRIIQTVSDNHLGGLDYVTNKYNFAGEVIQTRNRHTADAVTTYADTYFDLDHRGRLKRTRFSINGIGEILMSGNNYNEAGNLAIQYLHSESGGTFLQKNDYTYNIRGWMTQFNNPSTFTESDVFGMKLEYNTATTPLYNGNISKFTWGNSANPDMLYAYTYDANNRLTAANFTKTGVNANALDEGFAYDSNGNITKISRYDFNGVLIDSMKFTYQGNHLSGSYDKQGDVASVVDFPGKTTIRSVIYDQNGNETSEPHRYIATTYNMLNLPKQISWNGLNKKISYFYTFNGKKLRKTVEDNGSITKVDYCGPFVYETMSGTRSLKYILTPHGRAVKSGSIWEYEYNITDHLGNVRMVIKKNGSSPAIVQARHYYTFGMEMSQLNTNGSTNKLQYNSKELQDDFGLYWYDYGARFYDPMIGRWHTVDPSGEQRFSFSPYNFCSNNPIIRIDSDGALDDIVITGENNSRVTLETDLIDVEVDASSLGIDFGGNYSLAGEDVLSAGLDIAGIVDPTGVADGLNAGLQAKNGQWGGAIISGIGLVPYIGDIAKVGKIGKDVKVINNAIDALKSSDNLKAAGRSGKQERLRELANDRKVSSADRGWIKNEKRHIENGNRKTIRNPGNSRNSTGPGKVLAHPKGQRAKDGHSYKNAKLQDTDLHKLEHKHEGY